MFGLPVWDDLALARCDAGDYDLMLAAIAAERERRQNAT